MATAPAADADSGADPSVAPPRANHATGRVAAFGAACRLAVGLLTVVPAGVVRMDRATAGRAMALAPVIGGWLGLAAAFVVRACDMVGLNAFVAATMGIGALALLSRLLHLDGLADTADALGSGKSAAAALDVMKRSDIGPFGVVAVVIAVLLQVGALASAIAADRGAVTLALAATAGRLPLPFACRPGVPAARPEGLGALVAGTVRLPGLALASAVVILAATGAALMSSLDMWRAVLAVVLGLGAALLLLSLCVRRFGGTTGDVLGALVEVATTVTLLTLAT